MSWPASQDFICRLHVWLTIPGLYIRGARQTEHSIENANNTLENIGFHRGERAIFASFSFLEGDIAIEQAVEAKV